MRKKLKFPSPREATSKNPLLWRGRELVIRLYNQYLPKGKKKAKNLTKNVESWVREKAKTMGWQIVVFPLEYPSRTLKAGAVFAKKLDSTNSSAP